jgi:hypothetical protein
MTSSLTKNGVSTTTERDCFRYETYQRHRHLSRLYPPVTRVQWDYRDAAGELHSGVARSVEQAKEAARRFGYKG